jgi:hypothetical protein
LKPLSDFRSQSDAVPSNRASPNFSQGLAVLAHFKVQLLMLGDQKTLRLLEEFEGQPFTNGEAKQILEMKRQTTWKHLAQLTEAGLVEKRGHTYRVSRFTSDFVGNLSASLRSTLMGTEMPRSDAMKEVLRTASQGVEILYARGKIDEREYSDYCKTLEELTASDGNERTH